MEYTKETTLRGYRELANYLNIGVDTARLLMNRKGFPTVEISPRVRLISIAALERWMQAQQRA